MTLNPPGDLGLPDSPTGPVADEGGGPRGRRILKWTAIVLAGSLLVVAAGVGADVWWLDHKIDKQPVVIPTGQPGDKPRPQPAADATKAENFVLIGSDTRAGASGRGTGGSDVSGARADTTIILHISANDQGATLISIPRDSYVQIPSCVVNASGATSSPEEAKFNSAFAIGAQDDVKYGGSCTVHTIETLTGVPMNHYAVIDFAGFTHMIDALGGVNVCVATPLVDPKVHNSSGYHGTNLNLQPGPSVHIDGTTALKLMRARYALDGGGDLPRIKRQQTFMAAMIRKATSSSLLTNPIELQRFLSTAASSLTTDGFGLGTMKDLAEALHREGAGKVRLLTVPNYAPPPGSPLYGDVVWQQPQADELWAALLHDKPIPGLAKKPALTVPPSDISIDVKNGTTDPGEAQKVAQLLTAQGYHAIASGRAIGISYPSTVVRYGSTKAESSQTVARSIPGSVRQATASSGTTITVIVGNNFATVKPVTIGNGNRVASENAATNSCLS